MILSEQKLGIVNHDTEHYMIYIVVWNYAEAGVFKVCFVNSILLVYRIRLRF